MKTQKSLYKNIIRYILYKPVFSIIFILKVLITTKYFFKCTLFKLIKHKMNKTKTLWKLIN